MKERTLAEMIANSKSSAIKKLVEDGLIQSGGSIEIPFGTSDVCPIELLDKIKEGLEQEGYQVNALSRPVKFHESIDYERFLVVRRVS